MAAPLRGLGLAVMAAAAVAPAGPAGAFSTFGTQFYSTDPYYARLGLTEAPRWDADPAAPFTLADGISVSVTPGFGAALAALTPLSAAEYDAGVAAAFAAWETPELRFDITFEPAGGSEIDLFAVDSSHPAFVNFPGFASGITFLGWQSDADRQLTNGQVLAGPAIDHADIFVAVDRVPQFFNFLLLIGFVQEQDRLARFTNFMIHEIGHALGFHHPDDPTFVNYDTDLDPLNAMPIDPLDPLANMRSSPNIDPNAIMISGLRTFGGAYLFTELTNDDRGGRDVLYPSVPEPGAALLLLAGLALWPGAARRGQRSG